MARPPARDAPDSDHWRFRRVAGIHRWLAPLGSRGCFITPGAILGTAMAAATMRMTRTMMLEALRPDDVRTAWSKV